MPTLLHPLPVRPPLREAPRDPEAARRLVMGALSLEAGGVRQFEPELPREVAPIAIELGEEYGVEAFLEGLKAG